MLLVWLGRFGGESRMCICWRRPLPFFCHRISWNLCAAYDVTLVDRIGGVQGRRVCFGLVCAWVFAYLFVGEDPFDPFRRVSWALNDGAREHVVGLSLHVGPILVDRCAVSYMRWPTSARLQPPQHVNHLPQGSFPKILKLYSCSSNQILSNINHIKIVECFSLSRP
jgi:hypothetical protein